MAKNDFSAEEAQNYEQKCLCVLVLDISGSMNAIVDRTGVHATGETVYVDGKEYKVVEGGITKLDKLIEGLEVFYKEIAEDEKTSQQLELAVITFNDKVETVQSPSLIEECEVPFLEADGETALVDAVNEAIDLVADRKQWYKDTGQPYYRPWIILMTDGEPDNDQDVDSLARRIKRDVAAKRYMFLPIGVEGANMNILKDLDPKATKLQGTKFMDFFRWLSASMGTIITSEEGQTANLREGASDWMDYSFVI